MVKQILITGGLGYVGGRVAAHLRERHPSLGIRLTSHRERQELPLWAGGFDIHRMDMTERDTIAPCLEGIDAVINLATPDGINNLTERAIEGGVEKFISVSTCHVYGENLKGRVTEETPTKPLYPYASSHLAAEKCVLERSLSSGISSTCLRLSNSYGYPMDVAIDRWGLVVNDFCRQIVRDKQIVLNSDGSGVRDFIPLEDVARAVEHVLFGDQRTMDGRTFNLGGECTMSILDMAHKVEQVYREMCDGSEKPIIVKGNAGDSDAAERFEYSLNRLKDTGFKLSGNMDKEIERTLRMAEGLVS